MDISGNVGVLSPKEAKTPEERRNLMEIWTLAFFAVGVIGCFDAFGSLPYLYKAIGKIILFIGVPLYYHKRHPSQDIKGLFARTRRPLEIAGILGLSVIVVIWTGYYIFQSVVDLAVIRGELETRMEINRSNFIAVALYIAIINSFLEEFFFRGFLFFRMKENGSRLGAHLGSAGLFSLYHVGMMLTWFQWWVFAVCILALMIGGVIFNLLDEATGSLYPSWLTHGCANLAINAVGMILFYFSVG